MIHGIGTPFHRLYNEQVLFVFLFVECWVSQRATASQPASQQARSVGFRIDQRGQFTGISQIRGRTGGPFLALSFLALPSPTSRMCRGKVREKKIASQQTALYHSLS